MLLDQTLFIFHDPAGFNARACAGRTIFYQRRHAETRLILVVTESAPTIISRLEVFTGAISDGMKRKAEIKRKQLQ